MTISYTEITEAHLEAVTEIYNHYVLHTTVSFDLEPASVEHMRASVINKDPRFKSFVIQGGKELKGYVLITRFKNKHAYDICGEVTIYLKPDCVGAGIGGQALQFIEAIAKEQGFTVLVAIICTENDRSIRLFEKFGYERCAHYKHIAFKFDRYVDIFSYQKFI